MPKVSAISRTAAPSQRLLAVEALAKAGIPVGVMVAPVIPGLTDHEVPEPLRDLPGVLYPNVEGLRRTLVHLGALDVLVSANTGPMHMAAALQVTTLSLFCPLASSGPELWGPLGNTADVLLPEAAYCRDRCPGDPHICTYQDSTEVSPSRVAARLLER